MTHSTYVLLGLTALVAALVAVLVFAALRFLAAARNARGSLTADRGQASLVAAALEDSLRRLREQERAMKARAEESERLNGDITASLTSGLLGGGLDGAVRTLTPAAARMLGRAPAETGAALRDVLAGAPPLAAAVEECLATGRPVLRRDVRVDRPGGGAVHYGVTVSPLFDGDGALQGAISLFTDLTSVVELEDQLRLKESLARLGELTAGLAHEFRNGLATIHGFARLIDPARLRPDDASSLQAIRDETESLGRVVGNFLGYARPDQPAMAVVEMAPLVARTLEEARAEIESRGGRVLMTGEFGAVMGDEVLLRRALANLVRNAVEACGQADVPPRIEVGAQVDRAQGVLRLTVSDNGPGVPAEAGDRIFRPFFTTRHDGTGLGLAIVQKIVVTHNGRITHSAREGGGAAFLVTLPLADHA
jgi:signal transduction histidine kinase